MAEVSDDVLSRFADLLAEVGKSQAELSNEVRGLRTDIANLQKTDKTLADGVGELKQNQARLDERVRFLEDGRREDQQTTKALARSIEKVAEAATAIVEELGIEDRVSLGRSLRPGEPKPTPKLQAIHNIERRSKNSTVIQVVIALGMLAELASRFWPQH